MNNQEILEYNKRCALFLGYKFKYFTDDRVKVTSEIQYVWGSEAGILKQCDNWWRCSKTPDDNFSWHFPIDLKFHSDWNWIMEVVGAIQKIIVLDGEEFCIEFFYDITKNKRPLKTFVSISRYIDEISNKDPKKAVVKAINQFLIWYEKNKT